MNILSVARIEAGSTSGSILLDGGVGFEGMCSSRSGWYLPSKGTLGSWATSTISVSTHVSGVCGEVWNALMQPDRSIYQE